MGDTTIEWTDKVWNPVSGCSHVSEGCRNCYAERVFPRSYSGRKFTDVQCHPERLEQPLRWRKPQKIFVNSMSDLFHESVKYEFIDKVFAVMGLCPQHTFQILTKRPWRMLQYLTGSRFETLQGCPKSGTTQWHIWSAACGLPGKWTLPWSWKNNVRQEIDGPWPLPNVWLGVSVEDQGTADERIPLLLSTPAAIRWVSYEPALGPVNFEAVPLPDPYLKMNGINGVLQPIEERDKEPDDYKYFSKKSYRLDWIVAGGESGSHSRPPNPDWLRKVRDDCQDAGVPFFFKQHGEWGECPKPELNEDFSGGYAVDVPYGGGGRTAISCFRENSKYFRVVDGHYLYKCGKHKAGRLLDGREWNEFPEYARERAGCGETPGLISKAAESTFSRYPIRPRSHN